MKKILALLLVLAMVFSLVACAGSESASSAPSSEPAEEVIAEVEPEPAEEEPATVLDADSAIEKVSTIAFMASDGPKVQAIVLQYSVELTAGSVGTDTYEAYTYANLPAVFDVGKDNGGTSDGEEAIYPTFAKQNGTPGEITNVYVSATPEVDPEGKGDEAGQYVIVEVNTDYMLEAASSSWRACVAGGVEQLNTIESGNVTINPTTEVKGNYELSYNWDINMFGSNHSVSIQVVRDDSLYTLHDLDGYQIFITNAEEGTTVTHEASEDLLQYGDRDVTFNSADTTVLSKIAGEGFKATNCYSEYDGEYHDVDMMYCLYVPEDYDPAGTYGLVLHIIDAGALGTDPMNALTECQAAANYASDEVQQLAKDQGLDGLIICMPFFTTDDQTIADNLTANQFLPATWQLMDSLTETYSIDTNRIYGSGQSMGGMQLLYMAAQRDNYFAGIWAIGSQWGNNYNKSEVYGMGPFAHEYYTFPDDSEFITNPDWQNWYYSISDDNILVTSMTGDATAAGYWNLTNELFDQFAGVTIPSTEIDPINSTIEEQNAALQSLLGEENELGIYWYMLSNGSHKATWLFAHAISDGYAWLLSQTKESEDARGKLEELAGSYEDNAGTAFYSSEVEVEMEAPPDDGGGPMGEDGPMGEGGPMDEGAPMGEGGPQG